MKQIKLLPILGICAIAPTLPVMITSCGGDKTGNKIKVTNATSVEAKAHLDKLQVPTEIEKGKDLVITLSSHSGWVIDSEKTDIKIGDDSLTADEMTIDYDNGTITIANVKIEAHGSKNITVLVAVREATTFNGTITVDSSIRKIDVSTLSKTSFTVTEKQAGSVEITFTTKYEKCNNDSLEIECKNCNVTKSINGTNGLIIISWTGSQSFKASSEGMNISIKDKCNNFKIDFVGGATSIIDDGMAASGIQGQAGTAICKLHSNSSGPVQIRGEAIDYITIDKRTIISGTTYFEVQLSWTAEQSWGLSALKEIEIA